MQTSDSGYKGEDKYIFLFCIIPAAEWGVNLAICNHRFVGTDIYNFSNKNSIDFDPDCSERSFYVLHYQ